jgi:dTMP kinase
MATTKSRGLFVVLEGLDGSGTSTQARMLHERFIREGSTAYLTSEPTTGPIGNLIKLTMSHRLIFSADESIEDKQLAYMFAADRFDHLHNKVDGILSRLAEGAIVISTRYYLSSYAYHCKDENDFPLISRLNKDFPPADLTLFLDIPVKECVERISKSRAIIEKYETEEKLNTVLKNYKLAMENYKAPLFVLDGNQEAGKLHNSISSIIEEKSYV